MGNTCPAGQEEALVSDTLRSTWVSGGPYAELFERELARLLEVEFAGAESAEDGGLVFIR